MRTPRLTRQHLAALTAYDWPGNVRELENVIERAVILSKHSGKLNFDLPAPTSIRTPRQTENKVQSESEFREQEAANILAALHQTKGKVFGPNGAANLLGLKPTTLASRIKALGLRKEFVSRK